MAAAAAAVVCAVVVAFGGTAGALGLPQALLLGLVEGVTEFLPVSSTGHLLVTQRLFGMAGTPAEQVALDSYVVVIQGGAILAVGLLYRARLAAMVRPRAAGDRRVLVAVAIAAAPAGLIGLLAGDTVKDRLFGPGPVAVAWFVGGIAILVVARRLSQPGGSRLEDLTPAIAVVVGLAQVIALWPGVSRSLVTIVAGVFVGLSLAAAVELSFLLGFVTLLGATGIEVLRGGSEIVTTLGWAGPLVGTLAAFAAAVVAIRGLVSLVATSSLRPFGWYRIGAAAGVVLLGAAGLV